MTRTLARLLNGAMDYAGPFPPAGLPVPEAVAEYIRHTQGPEAPFLGRFACPAASLWEVVPLGFGGEITVIGRSADRYETWQDARVADADDMTAYEDETGLTSLAAIEVRLPDDYPLQALADLNQFEGIDRYAEIPWTADIEEIVAAMAEAEGTRAKVRCGPTPPSDEALAAFLHQAVSLELPFKLTAGLHHAWRQPDGSHGFINVLGSVALCLAHDLSHAEVVSVLADPDPEAWRIDPLHLAYRDWVVSAEDADHARSLMVAFGTCSIRQPWADLKAQGWVE